MSAIRDLPAGSDAFSKDPPDIPLPTHQDVYPPLPPFTSSTGPRPLTIPFPVVSGPTAPNTPLNTRNLPRVDEPRVSVLPDSPTAVPGHTSGQANQPLGSIPQLPPNARPDYVIDGSNIPPEILSSLLQEQIRQDLRTWTAIF
ncbi:hypothetical protein PCANC_12983 [Puccinia coronata f. sp. avenae]|uniref:Uncharacterized protein n=1 Tax=Puccinia coronata f. sp. avenae TaxID=200324 RepID=A0A2N5SSS1_9BASI|nr:hypothetical protein PCANC_12983 [Puccinia coronata f. sp. avenae]